MTTARSEALDRAGVTSDHVKALEHDGYVIVQAVPSDVVMFEGMKAAVWTEWQGHEAVRCYPPLDSIRAAWRAILAVLAAAPDTTA